MTCSICGRATQCTGGGDYRGAPGTYLNESSCHDGVWMDDDVYSEGWERDVIYPPCPNNPAVCKCMQRELTEGELQTMSYGTCVGLDDCQSCHGNGWANGYAQWPSDVAPEETDSTSARSAGETPGVEAVNPNPSPASSEEVVERIARVIATAWFGNEVERGNAEEEDLADYLERATKYWHKEARAVLVSEPIQEFLGRCESVAGLCETLAKAELGSHAFDEILIDVRFSVADFRAALSRFSGGKNPANEIGGDASDLQTRETMLLGLQRVDAAGPRDTSAISPGRDEEVVSSCGCVFCDLDLKPEEHDGQQMHHVRVSKRLRKSAPEPTWEPCTRTSSRDTSAIGQEADEGRK